MTPRPVPAPLAEATILPNLLRRRAEEDPGHVFAHEVGGGSRDYATMLRNTYAWGAFFQSQGVERGEIVASFLDSSLTALEIWMGLTWAGGVEAALNRGYRHQLLADVVNDTTARMVITTSDFLPILAEVSGNLDHVSHVIVIDVREQISSRVEGWFIIPGDAANEQPFDVDALVAWAAEQDLEIVAVDNTPGSVRLETATLPRRCLLLFGQEGPGVSEDARLQAVQTVSIAQFGSTRSINAGVAAGIAMHAWIREHAAPIDFR